MEWSKQNENREMHYSMYAKRFAMDAKMLRSDAAIHVEDKEDVVFWNRVLKYYRPDLHFHFISASRNERGNETSGVTQCLKYFNYLNKNFLLCIDSDYRYLLRQPDMNAAHFILQTYTYSFENHHCYVSIFDDVCLRITKHRNTVFDFAAFLSTYSRIIYPLFLWHLYFLKEAPSVFSKNDFNGYLKIVGKNPRTLVRDGGFKAFSELSDRVDRRIKSFRLKYPEADTDAVDKSCRELGVSPETAYMFLRGHNIFDTMVAVCREVCRILLSMNKNTKSIKKSMADFYRNQGMIDAALKREIKFGEYPAILKIRSDIEALFPLKD